MYTVVHRVIVLHSAGFRVRRVGVCVKEGGIWARPAGAQASKATPEGRAEPTGGTKAEPRPGRIHVLGRDFIFLKNIF